MNDIKSILEKIGYSNIKELPDHYQTTPIYRDSDNPTALVIKKDSGVYYDFVERKGGSFKELVQRTLKLKTLDEAHKLLEECDFEVDLEKKDNKHISFITMQKTFDKNMLLKLIKKHDYWVNRGISQDTIQKFNGGVTFNGRLTNRYVFPIFNDKTELVGFAGRLLVKNDDFPKWKLISQKQNWIYPTISHLEVSRMKSAILVESIGNMLSLYEIGIKNVIVTFGVSISSEIIKFLLKSDVNKISIVFDNDEQNKVGQNAAIDARAELLKYFDENSVSIIIPESKDLNEMLIEDRDNFISFCQKMDLYK